MQLLSFILIVLAVLLLRRNQSAAKLTGGIFAVLAVVLALASILKPFSGGGYDERVRETRVTFQNSLNEALETFGDQAEVTILIRPFSGNWPPLTDIEQDELDSIRQAIPSGRSSVQEMKPAGGWRGLQADSDFALDEEDPEVQASLVYYALSKYITPETFSFPSPDTDVILSHLPLPIMASAEHFPAPGQSPPIVLLAPAPPMNSPSILKETSVAMILAPVPPGLFTTIHGSVAAKKTYDPIVYHAFTEDNVDDLFAEMMTVEP